MQPNRLTIVQTIATSYAGGTWLNLMLASHPDAFGVGELMHAYKIGRAGCQLHGDACPVWSRFNLESSEDPVLQIARIVEKPVIVINNSPQHISQELLQRPEITARYVHLVRDGRAVTASYMRKNPGRSVAWAMRRWRRHLKKNLRLIRGRQALTVRYEDLQTDTAGQLARICEHIGIDFTDRLLRYWEHDHCYLGGNRGTLFALSRKAGVDLPEDPRVLAGHKPFGEWDREHYSRTDPAAFVDERWKQELSWRQLAWFRIFGGSLNRKMGY
jgi:hypothetical protein